MSITLESIPGIGPKTLVKLHKLRIFTPTDLVYHFPSRYIDFSKSVPISQARINENITITGKIIFFRNIFTRNHKNIQLCKIADKTGILNIVWFNSPFLSKNIKINDILSFAGSISLYKNQKTLFSPDYGQYNTGKIIPKYPETKGLSSKWFRKTIQSNLEKLLKNEKENLPLEIIKNFTLLDKISALTQIHNPKNNSYLNNARLRLSIDEILSLQTQSYLQKENWLTLKPHTQFFTNKNITKKINKLINSLPFKLTKDQKKVWQEISQDLLSPNHGTNRLLVGDVGSGKTIIAIFSCFLAHLNNSLSVVLAPTEILAQQHYKTFSKFLKTYKINIHLLTSNSKLKTKNLNNSDIIISTHAILHKNKSLLKKIALVIVDEQHKFGVNQRSALINSSNPPHSITMTATPIPRSISLTMLGNLNLSCITTMPKNRLSVKTFLVPNHKRQNCYEWIEKEIKKTKCQAFIVCPFIEESETLTSIKSAKKEFENLSKNIFPNLKLELLHGKTKSIERQQVIKNLSKNKTNILVTTPIIEVGIDIPNATILIIQSADRFGLAQLHQLRGRIGRGQQQSYCYLFTSSDNAKALDRLNFITKHSNNLKIARYDLKTRGPGEIFSTFQHGFPSLKLANLSNTKLISLSQKILKTIINDCPNFDLKTLIQSSQATLSTITN